jgi:photosystem II stability/assembly factor-like uncharacterized protein
LLINGGDEMRFILTIIIGLLIQFSPTGCTSGDGHIFPNASQSRPTQSLSVESRIPCPWSSGRSMSFNFAFMNDHRLWNTVNWGSKDTQFSFSDDLGKSWSPIEVPESLGTDSTIMFIDPKRGWAVASTNILRTKDGGKSWQEVPLPRDSKINEIKGITFSDSEHGFIAGSTSNRIDRGSGEETHSMEVLCTHDAGEHWSVCFKTDDYDLIYKIVSTKNAAVGLLWETAILRSVNNGATWERKDLDFKAREIAIDAQGRLWSLDHGQLIRHSSDLGDTWEANSVNSDKIQDVSWNSLAFNTDGVGVAVGDRGAIAVTTDSGQTWQPYMDVISDENLWTVRVQDSYIAILGEKNLYILRLNQ